MAEVTQQSLEDDNILQEFLNARGSLGLFGGEIPVDNAKTTSVADPNEDVESLVSQLKTVKAEGVPGEDETAAEIKSTAQPGVKPEFINRGGGNGQGSIGPAVGAGINAATTALSLTEGLTPAAVAGGAGGTTSLVGGFNPLALIPSLAAFFGGGRGGGLGTPSFDGIEDIANDGIPDRKSPTGEDLFVALNPAAGPFGAATLVNERGEERGRVIRLDNGVPISNADLGVVGNKKEGGFIENLKAKAKALVKGKDPGTADNVPIQASVGEFVVKEEVASNMPTLLEKINSLSPEEAEKMETQFTGEVQKLAEGGEVLPVGGEIDSLNAPRTIPDPNAPLIDPGPRPEVVPEQIAPEVMEQLNRMPPQLAGKVAALFRVMGEQFENVLNEAAQKLVEEERKKKEALAKKQTGPSAQPAIRPDQSPQPAPTPSLLGQKPPAIGGPAGTSTPQRIPSL